MADIGMKHPVFAPIIDEPVFGVPTYGTGIVVGMAIGADETIERANDNELAADDTIAEVDDSFISGSITLNIDDISRDAKQVWLGMREETLNGRTGLAQASAYESPKGGFGYITVKKKAGIRSYTAIWYYKTKWSISSKRAATKPASGGVEWNTPTVEGRVMTRLDSPNLYYWEDTFDNEADAFAWLDSLANIPANESTGLSGLELTGTGGILSPVFGASVRYYTFGGVTATGITVKATAADHALKLYVDGVFSQNLTSGEASASIPVAVGTKKLTITAQELGKTVQTTEIIVEKVS